MRVLVVDDEATARRRLLDFAALEDDVQVVGECTDGRQACDDIARLAPDLVLLDVEMPELGGLDVVSALGLARMPATIFVTAHHRYAVSAFEADAMDFLLKPFDRERFARAIAKARAWMQAEGRAARELRLQAALANLAPASAGADRVWVRTDGARTPVRWSDVLYVEADGNYVHLRTAGARHTLRERLTGVLERLDPAVFRRVHRSHIVNLNHVKKRLAWFGGDGLLIMSDGHRLTHSRTYRDAFGGFG